MLPQAEKLLLASIVSAHPEVSLAYVDNKTNPPTLFIHGSHARINPDDLPHALRKDFRIRTYVTPYPRPLLLHLPMKSYDAEPTLERQCQDEPITAGTQAQPFGGNWVGTLGGSCRFTAHDQTRRIGYLTNWHVACVNANDIGRPIHQPLAEYPPAAKVAAYVKPQPNAVNEVDVALADSRIEGFHTCSGQILRLGYPAPETRRAQVGDMLVKVGRTTSLTTGVVTSANAAANVQYPHGICPFANQILITHTGADFARAGDSGSLCLHNNTLEPAGLLFAGSSYATLLNHLEPIIDLFQIAFTLTPKDLDR